MGMALYRKYRPKSLADVVGQDPIISTLKNALKKDALSHAYLFTGPRGVGKTSIARILAHEINKLPYTDDQTHLDIIEIDAASNRRIDEIRELRDKIHIAPTSSKYKVYIIDEVHMLTREAFNALLKTLEEPPAHAIFILATTEAHKVPETITSRAQRFSFRPILNADVVSHLQSIAKKEGITVSDDALELLAEHAKGSFRDSINLLDQLSATSKTITAKNVQEALGTASMTQITVLQDAFDNKNPSQLMQTLQDSRIEGLHAGEIANKLMQAFRERIQQNPTEYLHSQVLQLLQELLLVQTQSDPYVALELALLKPMSTTAPVHSTAVTHSPKEKKEALNTITARPKPEAKKRDQPERPEVEPTKSTEPQTDALPAANIPVHQNLWTELLASIKGQHNTLYSTLRMAQPAFENDVLTLTFRFAFHQKQISQAQNIDKIAKALQNITATPIQIVCVVGVQQAESHSESIPQTPTQDTTVSAPKAPISQALTDVSNIFDGAELLE